MVAKLWEQLDKEEKQVCICILPCQHVCNNIFLNF